MQVVMDDIDTYAPDMAVFHRVKARAEKGASRERLINQNEHLAVLRWAAFCERTMFNLAENVADAQRRAEEGMGIVPQIKASELK